MGARRSCKGYELSFTTFDFSLVEITVQDCNDGIGCIHDAVLHTAAGIFYGVPTDTVLQ